MDRYRLNSLVKEDLIRIHHYGVKQFEMIQAEKYIKVIFAQFEKIAQRPYSFESVDFIKKGY